MKQPGNLSLEGRLLKEKWYSCGMEISRPVEYMISDSYPILKRDRLSASFDPVIADEFDKARRRARFLLYEQRNLVQDKWIPRYILTHVPSRVAQTEAWVELKGLLVDGCLDRLSEMLIALAPIIVAKEYIESVQDAVMRVSEIEKEKLTEYLGAFHVQRKPGVLSIAEEWS